jgi:hypothetical protein
VFGDVLANNIGNARNFRWHLKHASFANKQLELFERKILEISEQTNLMRTVVSTLTKAHPAATEVSFLLDKKRLISSESHYC